MKPYILILGGLASAVLLGACDPYQRTNPLDPAYGLQVSIAGPDTIYSINDTVQFQVVTEPAHPELTFTWSTSDSVRLAAVATVPGTFTSRGNGIATITVENGPYRVEKPVVVSQRPVRLRIAPPPESEFASLGDFVTLTASIVDAKDTPVQGATADLQWSSTEPAVADVANGRVTARSNGTTWIRATSLGQADSLQVRVRQRPATLQFGSANYVIPVPGGSVQTVVAVRDARGNAIASPEGLTLASSRSNFLVDRQGVVQSTGFGSTVITATLDTLRAQTNVRVSGGTAPVVSRLVPGLTQLDTPGAARDFLVMEIEIRDGERDLEEATLELYSTESNWITTRVLPLEQGVTVFSTVVTMPSVPHAGHVRIRARDAATNQSALTTWPVRLQPDSLGGSPDAQVLGATRVGGDSVEVQVRVSDAGLDMRAVHLFGFNASWEPVFSRSFAVQQGESVDAQLRIGARTPRTAEAVHVGVLASDAAGNMSLVRVGSLDAASAASAPSRAWMLPPGWSLRDLTPSTGGAR